MRGQVLHASRATQISHAHEDNRARPCKQNTLQLQISTSMFSCVVGVGTRQDGQLLPVPGHTQLASRMPREYLRVLSLIIHCSGQGAGRTGLRVAIPMSQRAGLHASFTSRALRQLSKRTPRSSKLKYRQKLFYRQNNFCNTCRNSQTQTTHEERKSQGLFSLRVCDCVQSVHLSPTHV